MDALTTYLSQVGLTTKAPTPLFPNSVADSFFELPLLVQEGIVEALATGEKVRVHLVKGDAPFKLDWSETALRSLPAVSKAFRELAEPIVAAAIYLDVKDLTVMTAAMREEPVPPTPYEGLPPNLFPAYLKRGVKRLFVAFSQMATLDPVPRIDLSGFPALEALGFPSADPRFLFTTTATTLHYLPQAEQFEKAFKICNSIGFDFTHPDHQGPDGERIASRLFAEHLGGPDKLLLRSAVDVPVLFSDFLTAERVVRNMTETLCEFQRDKIVGISSDVKVVVVYNAPFEVRNRNLSLLCRTQTDLQ